MSLPLTPVSLSSRSAAEQRHRDRRPEHHHHLAPDVGFVGTDRFTYAGTESFVQGELPVTGTVTVQVIEVPPTAHGTTVDTTTGKAVGVDLAPLTTVTQGNTATFTVANPVHGTVTTTTAGSATFTRPPGSPGMPRSPTPSPTTMAARHRPP